MCGRLGDRRGTGTAACSIPYMMIEKYLDAGNWLGE
jgi:hypothetical protein